MIKREIPLGGRKRKLTMKSDHTLKKVSQQSVRHGTDMQSTCGSPALTVVPVRVVSANGVICDENNQSKRAIEARASSNDRNTFSKRVQRRDPARKRP